MRGLDVRRSVFGSEVLWGSSWSMCIGGTDVCLVHPREAFKPAMIEGSQAVIHSHNHPSGVPTPSEEDR